MANVARFHIARSPDTALSIRGAANGWGLLTSGESGQSATTSPAGLLLAPAQVAAIAPLVAWSAPAVKPPVLFDTLHSTLNAALLAGDHGGLERAASAFLAEHPPEPMSRRDPVEQRIQGFFRQKGRSSTAGERFVLHQSISREQRDGWFKRATVRIDREKAQALALAATRTPPPRDTDLLGGLRGDLAFCVLAASIDAARADSPRGFANKYVDRVLDYAAYLPPFIFEIDPCGALPSATAYPALGGRLARLAAYDEKMKVLAAASGRAAAGTRTGSAKESAAGSPGHADACDCRCDDPPCLPIDPCCAEISWYVTELLTLRERTHCYKPSDIAYIENVAPYETRIRTHGHTRTVAETSEDETNTSQAEERDHQVTDRFSLQKAIENQQRASLDVDAKLSGQIYGQDYEINTSASLSKESAYREAREQARETVDRATLSLQVQTRKLRTRTVATETTEQNKHKFKNGTDTAAVAKYFWVTQEKRGQLFSHGPAVTIDLLIPSPSLLFQAMERLKRERGFLLDEPVAPQKPTVGTAPLAPGLITPANYTALTALYGVVDYEDPPVAPPVLYVSATVSRGSTSQDITIPPGYTATAMTMSSSVLHRTWPGLFARISASFGGQTVGHDTDGNSPATATLNIRTSGAVTINERNATKDSSISVVITLTPDPVDLGPWRKSIYALIMARYQEALAKYEADLEDYNEALRAYNEAFDDRTKDRHPFACEEIMRAELKRSAIFMMCGEFDWPDVMNLKAQPCGLPWPNRKKADKATDAWYFFDRAFNWSLASFTFFDYFRNPMCKWVDAYEPDEPNFLFKAFLRAGYARVQLPVSPGMEGDVQNYLQTGGLWGLTGTRPANPADPRWISVIEEIKHSYDCFQQDREGHAEAYPDPVTGAFDSRVRIYTDRYWSPLPAPLGSLDQDAINLDLDREIFIDGIAYRIVSLVADPASPVWDPTPGTTMSWIVGLERRFESQPFIDPAATPPLLKPWNYAIGARFVGAPFHFDLPTDLIWIGDQGNPCLPCYPIGCVCDDQEDGHGDGGGGGSDGDGAGSGGALSQPAPTGGE